MLCVGVGVGGGGVVVGVVVGVVGVGGGVVVVGIGVGVGVGVVDDVVVDVVVGVVCMFDSFLFNPACAKVPVRTTNSHAQSISPASCRSKRVDDHSRFYANFRDFRGARVSTLTPHVLKPNADPVVLT